MTKPEAEHKTDSAAKSDKVTDGDQKTPDKAKEIGGPKGLEPTRYGDWERKGIVSDF